MPLYEFKCECGKVTETLAKMGTEEIECKCGKQANLQMSVGSFQLNGTGWYATDFRQKTGVGQ
jgi:putative FmdB family regulatory protein